MPVAPFVTGNGLKVWCSAHTHAIACKLVHPSWLQMNSRYMSMNNETCLWSSLLELRIYLKLINKLILSLQDKKLDQKKVNEIPLTRSLYHMKSDILPGNFTVEKFT